MKSNDFVRFGSGSNISLKEASPEAGIQKRESGSMPSLPVRVYFLPLVARYESDEIFIQ